MKKILIFKILFIFIFAKIPVFATNWVEIQPGMYIETDSISEYKSIYTYNDKLYSFWTKYYKNNELHWKYYSNIAGKNILYGVGMQIVNCNQKTAALKTTIFYDENNVPIKREETSDQQLKWKHLAPQTLGYDMWELLCTQQ